MEGGARACSHGHVGKFGDLGYHFQPSKIRKGWRGAGGPGHASMDVY